MTPSEALAILGLANMPVSRYELESQVARRQWSSEAFQCLLIKLESQNMAEGKAKQVEQDAIRKSINKSVAAKRKIANTYLVSEVARIRDLGVTGLSEKLKYDQKATYLTLYQIEKKNETTLLFVSFFLGTFGIDRFILGHTRLGLCKLLTLGGCGFLTFVDWFCIMSATKEYNKAVAYRLFQQINK